MMVRTPKSWFFVPVRTMKQHPPKADLSRCGARASLPASAEDICHTHIQLLIPAHVAQIAAIRLDATTAAGSHTNDTGSRPGCGRTWGMVRCSINIRANAGIRHPVASTSRQHEFYRFRYQRDHKRSNQPLSGRNASVPEWRSGNANPRRVNGAKSPRCGASVADSPARSCFNPLNPDFWFSPSHCGLDLSVAVTPLPDSCPLSPPAADSHVSDCEQRLRILSAWRMRRSHVSTTPICPLNSEFG